MAVATPGVAPCTPIFVVEVIDGEGFAWLYGPLLLHEALKISAFFEQTAQPGKEPRVVIPATLAGAGLADE